MKPSFVSLAQSALAIFSVAASPPGNAVNDVLSQSSILEKRADFHFRYYPSVDCTQDASRTSPESEGSYNTCYSAPANGDWKGLGLDISLPSSQRWGIQTFCQSGCSGVASIKQQGRSCYLPTKDCSIKSFRVTSDSDSSGPTSPVCPTGTVLPNTYCKTDRGELNQTTHSSLYRTALGYRFRRSCNSDYVGSDMVGILSGSWELCMEACASFLELNRNTRANVTCAGIVFVPGWFDQRSAIGNISYPGNCFLKTQMPRVDAANNVFEIVAAQLVN